MSTREKFLRSFLGALGAEEVVLSSVAEDRVTGLVIYHRGDPEEQQAFCWHMAEDEPPGAEVQLLAELLHAENLLDIDRITIPTEDLRQRFNMRFDMTLDVESFRAVLGELMQIRVHMVDDGRETDVFFIHD